MSKSQTVFGEQFLWNLPEPVSLHPRSQCFCSDTFHYRGWFGCHTFNYGFMQIRTLRLTVEFWWLIIGYVSWVTSAERHESTIQLTKTTTNSVQQLQNHHQPPPVGRSIWTLIFCSPVWLFFRATLFNVVAKFLLAFCSFLITSK